MKRKPPRKKLAPKAPPERSVAAPAPKIGPFPIVGVGASAGGLEAFSHLLRALPVHTGMALVLVQHLDPTHESHLTQVLARTTAMPVITVTDALRVEPDHVYVIPSNADMTIAGGVLALTPRAQVNHHLPIDHFFRSLATDWESRAIGVVLSGNGSDGTLGLKAIKAAGGLSFVQDEKSAKYAGMPHSASVTADFVLAPEGIARELARISRHPYVNHVSPSADADHGEEGSSDVTAVLRTLRAATGVDFSAYKPAGIRRRIARRMLLQKKDDVPAYARHLHEAPQEVQALHDDLLIQVTGFFRNPEGFDALKRIVFPSLVKSRSIDASIRIWVPGCATGEEAYSLVITLLEFLGDVGSNIPIQMFATDLSPQAIARARAGIYPESIASEVSPDRLQRFFVRTAGRYQISKAIRDACVFAQQDLTRDPPFSKLDLISCCNVLIYLNTASHERIIPVFHYALKPAGFLRLGSAEGVGRLTSLFDVRDKKHKIYARKPGRTMHLGFGLTAGERTMQIETGQRATPEAAAGRSEPDLEKEADRIMLARYAPAGVVVNAAMEIVQIRGKTGPYLEASPGAASLNLFKMAREGLLFALRQAVHKATRARGPVKTEDLRVRVNGAVREVSIQVIPLGAADGARDRHYLILFEERRRGAALAPPEPSPARAPRGKKAIERRVTQLNAELAATRRHLQAVIEEHEAAGEELRAATEEVQSSNEELQSTNEELETAKEELQATNEELTTVNDELNSRNHELSRLGNDLGNLLASVHVPIIMVGADLRIRRMTPAAERLLNVSATDIGRLIGDLRFSVDVPDLEALLREVIDTLTPREREVEARDGHWYSVRVRPYRTSENAIDGAVISFIDIEAIKRGLERAEEALEQARAIVETVRGPLVILDADLHVVTANRSFYETFGTTRPQTEGQLIFDLGNRQWNSPGLRTRLEEVLPRESMFEDFEVEHDFETIGRRTMLLNARSVLSAPGRQGMILLAIEDVTKVRRLEAARSALLEREQAVRTQAETATLAKDRFLAVLSHELRTPLTAMLGWTRVLRSGTLDPEANARALQVIERNTVLQVRLIEDLLDVSRIVAGTQRIEARPIMVAPTVEAAVAAMEPIAAAKGVVLRRALDEQAGPVHGDPTRLQQIVWNLVSNAIKFTPSGGRIEVRLERRGSTAEISVRDTGKGITAEELPLVFSRFGVTHTSSQSQGGLGLGLTIVRHLVELHGGTVVAESAGPDQGATFTVTLPLTDQPLADEALGIAARGLAPGRLPALDGVRVLVVDDEDDTRDLLREVLARCGAEVTVAATARAALEALEHAGFDVLVSDIVMPDEDGYDLIRKVRALDAEHGGQIPALAVTAYARSEDRTQAIAAGYQQHAAKPIEPADLAAAVATLAGRTQPETP
jgi:two-component system CheB/CheR fusion protein